MPTNLFINDKLLNKALDIGGKKTKKDTVNEALLEYVKRREQKKIIEHAATVEYFEDYEPKSYRSK